MRDDWVKQAVVQAQGDREPSLVSSRSRCRYEAATLMHAANSISERNAGEGQKTQSRPDAAGPQPPQ